MISPFGCLPDLFIDMLGRAMQKDGCRRVRISNTKPEISVECVGKHLKWLCHRFDVAIIPYGSTDNEGWETVSVDDERISGRCLF